MFVITQGYNGTSLAIPQGYYSAAPPVGGNSLTDVITIGNQDTPMIARGIIRFKGIIKEWKTQETFTHSQQRKHRLQPQQRWQGSTV